MVQAQSREVMVAGSTVYSNAEVKAGVFLTICLALFVAMLFIYGKVARVWRGREEIDVVFTSVTSLRPDAPVRYNGVEVGRVKDIRILHLDDPNIHRLPPFKAGDLDNLPLTEKEQKLLRSPQLTPPEQFQEAVVEKLKNRTMIELKLEVLQEGDKNRYHDDDTVNISTTLMGDTSVEITSGSGAPFDAKQKRLMLGHSGDFFSNLAKSVEQVKEILGSVSDVVGQDERESVRKALRRFDSITERIEKIVKLADDRLPVTWNKVDDLTDSAKSNLDKIGNTVAEIQPDVKKTLTTADDAVKDLEKRIGTLADTARDAVVEIKGDVKPIFADLQHITSKSKEDFPELVKNAKDLAGRLQISAGKVDAVLSTGERLLNESYPDLRRLIVALRMGAENFEEGSDLLKRRPWLILKAAPEDTALNTAQKTASDLERATRRFQELSNELQALRRSMDQAPKEKLERIDFVLRELGILSDTLKFAGDISKREVLPPFERKATSFVEKVEEFDPKKAVGRKPSEEK
jgi:ABC-type transporter Mla subunit MlaD